jgi:hypothetical protein
LRELAGRDGRRISLTQAYDSEPGLERKPQKNPTWPRRLALIKRQKFRAILRNVGRALFPACKVFGPNLTKMFPRETFWYDFSHLAPEKLIPVFLAAASLQKRTGPLHWDKTLRPAVHCPLP